MSDWRIDPDYLWSREGADPEVARLEALLAGHRLAAPVPPLPAAPMVRGQTVDVRVGWPRVAAAAAAVALAGLAALLGHRRGAAWEVEALVGSPQIGGAMLTGTGSLAPGEWLRTDGKSSALLKVADLGEVRIEPRTTLRIGPAPGSQRRLDLREGAIEARISAPPRLFIVDTPGARAVDMGCEYRLEMAADGSGTLRVFLGWVYLEHGGVESRVPMDGGECLIRPGTGPGTPFFDDAPAVFRAALASFDGGRASALRETLAAARTRDALSLWHLLSRTAGADRGAVYDRLAALKGVPVGLRREDILALDRRALDAWWDAMRPF